MSKMSKQHICNYEGCGKTFASNKNLKDHYRTHTGEKPYVCDKCNKRFGQYSTLHKHYRVHDKKRPYVCDVEGCHKSFTQVSNLIRHQRIHTGDKPYVCNECNKKFSSSSNLKQHKTIHKKADERAKFTCDICNKDYLYPSSLRKHKETEHNVKKPEPSKEESKDNPIEVENIEEISKPKRLRVKIESKESNSDDQAKMEEEKVVVTTHKAAPIKPTTNRDFMKSFVAHNQQNSGQGNHNRDSSFQYLRRQLGDNASCSSKSTQFANAFNAQEHQIRPMGNPFSSSMNPSMFSPVRKSALTRFSENYTKQQSVFNSQIHHDPRQSYWPNMVGPKSISGNSYNMNEQISDSSSVVNGYNRGDSVIRHLPPLNFQKEPEYLPIGIGGVSDQSNLKYHQMIAKMNENNRESDNRINSMFSNRFGDKSVISNDDHDNTPNFTFQKCEESSIRSSTFKGSLASFKANTPNSNPGFTFESQHKPPQNPQNQIKFANRRLKMDTDMVEGRRKDTSKSISSKDSSNSARASPTISRPGMKRLRPITTNLKQETMRLDPNSQQHMAVNFAECGVRSSPTIENCDKLSKFKKSTGHSQSSQSFKPTQKCIKDMTVSELQAMFPDISEMAKAIEKSKLCDGQCQRGENCPAGVTVKLNNSDAF